MRLSCGGHMHPHVHVHACMRAYLFPFLSVTTQSDLCFTNVSDVSVFGLSTFMSMYNSCQHPRAHTCRDHSHTLELRWWRVWRWFALAPQTIMHTNINTCVYVCTYTYICLFSFLSIPDSGLPNSLFLLDTGTCVCTTTSCRTCQPTFLPGFHCLGECACFLWLFTEYCAWVKVLN